MKVTRDSAHHIGVVGPYVLNLIFVIGETKPIDFLDFNVAYIYSLWFLQILCVMQDT